MRSVAEVAHDIGNIVASLKVRLYLLEKHPQCTGKHLLMVERLVGRLDWLTKDLLALARLEAEALSMQPVRLDLNAVIARNVEMYQPIAQGKELAMTFRPARDLRPILADEWQIERMITNLIANSIKYTLPGGVIYLTTRPESEKVVFTIQDTGIGISPKALPFIFERFYRSDEAKHTADGTGLGLAIVKEIVARHDGTIDVESAPESGTLFTITLPAATGGPSSADDPVPEDGGV